MKSGSGVPVEGERTIACAVAQITHCLSYQTHRHNLCGMRSGGRREETGMRAKLCIENTYISTYDSRTTRLGLGTPDIPS